MGARERKKRGRRMIKKKKKNKTVKVKCDGGEALMKRERQI